MCNFRVGQKVVLIGDTWREAHREVMAIPGVSFPVKGGVYTIREIVQIPTMPEPAIRVEEIINPMLNYNLGIKEPAWGVSRFRPVVERKTDITVFTRLLNPTSETVGAS